MIILSIISIILWFFASSFVSKLFNLKNRSLTSFLSILVILQTVWFFIMLNGNSPNIYLITQILFIVSISFYFILIIAFLAWKYKKNHLSINLEKVKASLLESSKEYIPYIAAFIVAIIFVIFTWSVDHDTWYYIKIANNFKESIFSSDGTDQLTSNIYKFPAMYYAISVFSPENIQMGFYILNPLINVFIGVSIVNNCMNKFKNMDIKTKLLISSILSMAIMFIIISTLNYSTGGNTVIQGLLFATIVSNIFLKKDFEISNENIVVTLSMLYFSSTGLMLSVPIIITIFIVKVFRKGINKTLELIPLIGILLLMSYIVFLLNYDSLDAINANNNFNIAYYVIFIISAIAWVSIFKFKSKLSNKDMSIERFIKINNIWIVLFSILFASIIIGSVIMWGFNFEKNWSNYINQMWILYASIYLIIGGLFIYQLHKTKTINWFILFLFIINFVSLLEVIVANSFNISSITSSIWRFNFLLVGYGNIPDICILLSIILSMLIKPLFNLAKNKDIKAVQYLNIHSKKIFSGTSAFVLVLSNFICFSSYFQIFSNSFLMKFDSNVVINTQNVSNHDKSILNSLEFMDFKTAYFTDMQISFLINNGVDSTYRLGRTIINGEVVYPTNSYVWNFYNIEHYIPQWNKDYSQNSIENTPIGISNRLVAMINEITIDPIKSINNNIISDIKYFILNKNTTYFSALESALNNMAYSSIAGDNMKVFYR